MATPLTPDQLLAALRKWGVRFQEIDGWRTRGRNFVGHGAWGPVIGCMTHHTADDAPDDTDLRIVRDGRSNLPGPLAQFGGRDDGTIDVIASGRANHAGTGDPSVYAAVAAQSYGDYPPPTHYHQGSVGGTDGNARFYGLEQYYSGGHPPTPLQYRAAVLLWAAICDAHGWSAKSVIGHKEWSDWKPDPGFVDMRDMRADIAHCLAIGPAAAAAWAYGTTVPTDNPIPSEEDTDMPAPVIINITSAAGEPATAQAVRLPTGDVVVLATPEEGRCIERVLDAPAGDTLLADEIRIAQGVLARAQGGLTVDQVRQAIVGAGVADDVTAAVVAALSKIRVTVE